jgi:hypothetical protein
MRFTDPTGHRCVEDGFEGSCESVGNKMTIKWKKDLEDRRNKWNIKKNLIDALQYLESHDITTCSGPNPGVMCPAVPELELSPDYTLPEVQQSSPGGYSNHDLDDLFLYWQIIVNPINELISMEDIYRMSSKGGWRASRHGLNLGLIEAFVQGSRQAYRDSWYQSLTPTQRFLRPMVVGGEAFVTDGVSGLVGAGYAAAGLAVGGPLGAGGGKLAGSTYATQVMDRFWMEKVNPNTFNFLGAWP